MKKSILICLMLSGGVAVVLSVVGHRDDVVQAAVEAREPASEDAPATEHRRAVQNVKLIFQFGEDKHYSVVCANGKYSLLHRERNQKQEEQGHTGEQASHQDQHASSHGLFELKGTLSTLPQDQRLLLTYEVSWEFSEHHKETTDHVEESEVARAAHDKDGAFAVSGNVAIRPGKTYTLGSFGETKLTVRVVVGEGEGGPLKVSESRYEKAKSPHEDAWRERVRRALIYYSGEVVAMGPFEMQKQPDRSLRHPLTPKLLRPPSGGAASDFESVWLKENPPQEGKPPK